MFLSMLFLEIFPECHSEILPMSFIKNFSKKPYWIQFTDFFRYSSRDSLKKYFQRKFLRGFRNSIRGVFARAPSKISSEIITKSDSSKNQIFLGILSETLVGNPSFLYCCNSFKISFQKYLLRFVQTFHRIIQEYLLKFSQELLQKLLKYL